MAKAGESPFGLTWGCKSLYFAATRRHILAKGKKLQRIYLNESSARKLEIGVGSKFINLLKIVCRMGMVLAFTFYFNVTPIGASVQVKAMPKSGLRVLYCGGIKGNIKPCG